AVNDLAAQGADYIKISFEPGPGGWPILSFEEARTVTDAAHERGLQVIAHVEDASYLDQAIDSGVDIITHIGYRWQGERLFTDMSNLTPDSTPFSNYDGYDALITRMVEHVALIPTLDVLIGERALDSAPAVGMTEVVRRFHERGGLVAVGDDYPLGVTQPGIPFGEIEHLLAAGLTPLEVITAGTKNAALVCGHGDDLGTLEAGKLADLIIVEGDPLEDLEALRNLKLVMIDGQIAFDYR
ncbi:MAG: amidohydrolase family protein, partial [Deinococcota bacterium]